jgi:hypothetical protein
MAEIASQGRVGEQGGGEAVVFDTSQFFQNVYSMQKDLYARQEQKKKEIDQQNATWNAYLDDMPDVWQSDYEYVNKALNEYNDYIIDLKTQGLDPEALDPTIMKKIKELQNKVAKESSRAKDNEMYSNQSFQLLNGDKANKYNKDYATKWLQDYGDPNKTPEQRAKMRIESNPFKLNYDINEFVKDTMPEDSLKDNGRVETIFVDKDAHKAVIFENITQTETGAEIYESLKKPNETPDEFAERMSELGQKIKPPRTKVQPAPQPRETKGDKFKGGYGTGNWNDKLSVSSQVNPSFKPGVAANTLYVTRTGTNDNVPPIQMADATGQTVNFQPISYHLRDDGAISVLGEVITGTGQDQVRTQTWMDYDANKAAFQSQLMGMDLRQEFNARNGGTTGAAKGSTSGGKTIKRSDIAAKAKASGYSQAEYEKLLTQKGVKIVD